MKPFEVRIVKRHLACYGDIIKQAADKDKEALLLQDYYEQVAGVKGISLEPKEGTSGGYVDKTSIYNQIFSDQLEADRMAAEYRRKAKVIEMFINAIEDERKEYLRLAFIEGKRYREIGKLYGYTVEGIHKAINRCLESVPSEMAKASGLL